MSIFDSIILGIVQGLTEFLPVSSSGHLVIFQKFLGLQEPGVTLEVLLHFGTLLSVFWVFRKDYIDLFTFLKNPVQKKFLILLVIGVIPTGIMGIIFKPMVENFFKSTILVGFMLLITGGLLWLIGKFPQGDKDIEKMKPLDAIFIGIMQGLAVMPGISRAGSTIVGALWRGLDKVTAVKYSFILSSPVILGATLLEVKDLFEHGIEKTMLLNYLIGSVFAFVFGVIAIKLFINLLKEKRFYYFSYYCWFAGFTIIIISLFW